MSTNLDLNQVLENQANKEVTINTATGQLDAAMTEFLSVDVSASSQSLTNTQYRRNALFKVTGAATSGRTVTVPALKRLSAFQADPANSDPISIVRGATSYVLSPGSTALIYTDGTADGLIAVSSLSSGGVKPYDVGTFVSGLPASDEKLLRFNYPRSVDLPASFAGSIVTAQTAATAQTDFTVTVNGIGIGTIRFAASGTVATFVGIGAQNLVSGDVLMIQAPTVQDATLADIAFTIAGAQV